MKNNELTNIIFGLGKGLIITSMQNHSRGGDFLENSYNDYFDHRNLMNHHHNFNMNNMNGMGINIAAHQAPNPLYHYFQQQQQPLYMYPNEYHRRH